MPRQREPEPPRCEICRGTPARLYPVHFTPTSTHVDKRGVWLCMACRVEDRDQDAAQRSKDDRNGH